ncbi:hypothetical protein Tco_0478992 [Tanacetum coccineum]
MDNSEDFSALEAALWKDFIWLFIVPDRNIDAEPQGLNVVTGTFLLNNQYASVLFDSGSDRSFVNTRFSSLLDIKPIKIEDSYKVELAD